MKGLKVILLALSMAMYISCSSGDADSQASGDSQAASENVSAAGDAALVKLEVGDDAPLFTLPGTPGKADISLVDAIKEKPVLLAFYPKAFTGG